MIVFLMRLEMVGQTVDTLGQDGDLDFRRAGVIALGRIVFSIILALASTVSDIGCSFRLELEGLTPETAMAGMSSSQVAMTAALKAQRASGMGPYTRFGLRHQRKAVAVRVAASLLQGRREIRRFTRRN